MAIEVVTVEDLEKFRIRLLAGDPPEVASEGNFALYKAGRVFPIPLGGCRKSYAGNELAGVGRGP